MKRVASVRSAPSASWEKSVCKSQRLRSELCTCSPRQLHLVLFSGALEAGGTRFCSRVRSSETERSCVPKQRGGPGAPRHRPRRSFQSTRRRRHSRHWLTLNRSGAAALSSRSLSTCSKGGNSFSVQASLLCRSCGLSCHQGFDTHRRKDLTPNQC